MGNTRDTGYLRNLVAYDGSGNITLPANLTVTGTITGYATTSYVGTQLAGYVPTTRTISINGTSLDLSVNRSFTINSMVYPGAGIAVSIGSAWGTSLTDNSGNWNTAFGWGNHAGLYSLLNHTHTFASLTSKPTTLVGYGITDAATSAQGTNADTAYGWGNHGIAGYLTGITSGQVTTALGFTPYNATNPTGYITSAALSTYATQTYVGTQIANLVASSPAALDTLNELAAALGNDAAFSTTVSTALGNRLRVDINTQGLSVTLQGYGRTNLGLGSAAVSNTGDFVAYRTFGTAANSATGDFVAYRTFGTAANNNTGDFALASHTHIIANVTGLQTALDGKQASGSYAAAAHSHIISDVTGLQTALDGKQASLGFTPYNSTNPSGYIALAALSFAAGSGAYNNTTGIITIPTNNNQLTNGAGYLTSVTTITGNAGSATLLKSVNTTQSVASTWNPQSLTYQAWGQAFGHSSISADTGDIALWLRPSQYVGSGTEVCMIIDGDYYAGSGAQKVLHAGNYGSYALPLGGGTMTNQITWSSGVAPISFQQGGNSGTYTQTTIYANQNNTSASDANGIFIERGYTDTSNTELRRFVIGARGGSVQWRLDGPGNVTQTGGLTATYLTTSGEGNFGPDSSGDNGIRIRFGSGGADYGRIRFMQAGVNTQTIHCFSSNWQGGAFLGASAGAININGTNGVTFGGWNMPDAHISPDALYIKSWATPSGAMAWNSSAVLRLQQGSTGDNVFMQFRNRADAGDYAGILFSDNNIGGYLGFRTYASNDVGAGSDCMIYGTYNDHIFQNGSSGTFNGKTETFRIYANGSVRATGDITAYSDRRVKENIITIDNALEKTLALRGVFYNRTDKDDKSQKLGVIAQEIQEILPQVVNEDYNGLLSVSYGNITGVLIEAIKEQQAQIKSQKNEIDELKDLVHQLINR